MFSASKPEPKPVKATGFEPKSVAPAAPVSKPTQEVVSTFGHGMLITGNIVCTGALQIYGRVTGEIHAAHLVVCEGAKVEGKITAPETVIQGSFNGTIHGNSVKLLGSAMVDGEIYNKSLTIEQNAQFEGVSRRLERPVEAPTADQISGAAPSLAPGAHLTNGAGTVSPAVAPAGEVVS